MFPPDRLLLLITEIHPEVIDKETGEILSLSNLRCSRAQMAMRPRCTDVRLTPRARIIGQRRDLIIKSNTGVAQGIGGLATTPGRHPVAWQHPGGSSARHGARQGRPPRQQFN